MFEAKIIKDSIGSQGQRLTTMQLTHPRIIHAEFMTHRMFARCASSSRAIPFPKVLEKVKNDPFLPVYWGVNQKGMQAEQELAADKQASAISKWLRARDLMIEVATDMADPDGLNVHKQIANRLLECWSFITVCVTGDAGAWSNFFSLRCHKMAQPEIQKVAFMARDAYAASTPDQLMEGQWHLPYITAEDLALVSEVTAQTSVTNVAPPDIDTLIKVSVGRCARTSYLSQEGKRDLAADVALHDRLVASQPLHASPAEHVCVATGDLERHGCYTGWLSYRHTLQHEYVTDYTIPKA